MIFLVVGPSKRKFKAHFLLHAAPESSFKETMRDVSKLVDEFDPHLVFFGVGSHNAEQQSALQAILQSERSVRGRLYVPAGRKALTRVYAVSTRQMNLLKRRMNEGRSDLALEVAVKRLLPLRRKMTAAAISRMSKELEIGAKQQAPPLLATPLRVYCHVPEEYVPFLRKSLEAAGHTVEVKDNLAPTAPAYALRTLHQPTDLTPQNARILAARFLLEGFLWCHKAFEKQDSSRVLLTAAALASHLDEKDFFSYVERACKLRRPKEPFTVKDSSALLDEILKEHGLSIPQTERAQEEFIRKTFPQYKFDFVR